MKTLLAACVLALAAPSSAQLISKYRPAPSAAAAGGCPRVPPMHVGGTQGYADGFSSGLCYISIDPVNTTRLIYRATSIFSDGVLMVFSSYGDGSEDNPNLTSAREFRFFPRLRTPELLMDPAKLTIAVRMADGGLVSFDQATGQIASFERGSVTVSPRVDPAERGGVEITSYAGLLLDSGFRMGEMPSGRPAADSTFRSAQGQLCTVKNSELFAYANGDRTLKFTDAQLSAWLKTRCPGLNVGF